MGRNLEREVQRRRRYAWKLRRKGKTFREIGQLLGVSGESARQLVVRFEREREQWEAERTAGSLLYHLHVVAVEKGHARGVETRVRNCLRAVFGAEAVFGKEVAEEISQLGRNNLLLVRGMGRQTVELLEEALQEMGFALKEEGPRGGVPPIQEQSGYRPPSGWRPG